jgi:hypothetical protein
MRPAVSAGVVICMLLSSRAGLIAAQNNADEGTTAASGTIVVRVIDEAGAPRAGATLNLYIRDFDRQHWKEVGRESQTDASGVATWKGLATDDYYLVRAKTGGLVGFRGCSVVGENARYEADVKLERPATPGAHVQVRDAEGRPIGGARMWSLHHEGANGSLYWNSSEFASCGFAVEPSNQDGQLVLPPLPPGRANVRVIHRITWSAIQMSLRSVMSWSMRRFVRAYQSGFNSKGRRTTHSPMTS